jgi:hypothetical protein
VIRVRVALTCTWCDQSVHLDEFSARAAERGLRDFRDAHARCQQLDRKREARHFKARHPNITKGRK